MFARVDQSRPNSINTRSLRATDTVKSGDYFSVTTWVDQSAHLYVVDYKEQGWSRLLFSRPTPITPREQIRLPQNGSTYNFDDQPGQEHIYVYASRKPLDEKGCKRLRIFCPANYGSSTRGGKDAPPPPPPPPPPTRLKRSGAEMIEGDQTILRAESDPAGIALLQFVFNHVR